MFLVVINLFEILAAIVATKYSKKYQDDKLSWYFSLFLWFTVAIEIIFGWLPAAINKVESLSFLKDTFLNYNPWAYDLYNIMSFSFFLFYFLTVLSKNRCLGKRDFSIIFVFVCFCILIHITFDFFSPISSNLVSILGTLFLSIVIIVFYLKMLKSDLILNFYKILPFYVSIGILIFNLVVNPIFIYQSYYSIKKSPEFVELFKLVIMSANIFMYTCFIFGLIICSKPNKISLKKNYY